MDDVRKIAEGLSKAQREMFLHPLLAPVNGPDGERGGFAKELLCSESPIKPDGCFNLYTTTPGYEKYQLTPLGLAVRAYLKDQEHG